jgi:hypothetical protein
MLYSNNVVPLRDSKLQQYANKVISNFTVTGGSHDDGMQQGQQY